MPVLAPVIHATPSAGFARYIAKSPPKASCFSADHIYEGTPELKGAFEGFCHSCLTYNRKEAGDFSNAASRAGNSLLVSRRRRF